jgi:gluconate 2-dehydrogenase gamma chain
MRSLSMARRTQADSNSGSRRNFLKISAGAVVGAVGVSAYGSGVIGANNSRSSPTVASLQNELTTAQSQLSDTTSSLSSANDTISSLQSTVSSQSSQISSLQSSVSALSQLTAFQFFNPAQQAEVIALASAIIPTDSNGPGATTAGVVYFVDGQLAGDYGNNANMYLTGPYVQPSTPGPLTVDGTTYSGGSAPARLTAGGGYQYPLKWQEFWRSCLQWTEDYSNSAYGGNFEDLSAANQTAVLTDLWNNKPTNFIGITPQAWFSELHDMVWAGFFTDPLYGGNRGMVGWLLTGFTGTNQGNAYGEGYSTIELMVATKPVPLKPQSLAQFQVQAGELPPGGA